MTRDHGGELRKAAGRFGGSVGDWLDLSTGINPIAYPVPDFSARDLGTLPDPGDIADLEHLARAFWNVPSGADILAAPGASALIAQLPVAVGGDSVNIHEPTYNEHRAAFEARGAQVSATGGDVGVLVHPNNPDGRLWSDRDCDGFASCIIDESFCDIAPDRSLVALTERPGCLVLKSFGKFWGLAGLRLGFAIGDPVLVGRLRGCLGPWAVSGPALRAGMSALSDPDWADAARVRLAADAARLDRMMEGRGHMVVGGTSLFRLYETVAARLHERLARAQILTRVFPYNDRWIRFGLPGSDADWSRLEAAL